eukprot:m.126517 g.126517  ORF g.126517 m.126517 type:complete len:311 (-) comp14518_c0_seq3:118-1050(-)
MTTTKEFFDKNGYAVVEGFASEDECNNMMSRMAEILSQWVPKAGHSVFTTGKNQEQARGDYFLESADKVSVFLEAEAVTESGELKCEKHLAVNKVGHGLHVVEDVFREYSFSEKVKNLVKDLGWKDPVLPQSMYIFKQPGIGGEVTPHQDSTFLYTEPQTTCLGLWLALEDATLENGCLWARPGSHKEPVRKQFVRNPEYFKEGNKEVPRMIFNNLVSEEEMEKSPWVGEMPGDGTAQGLSDSGFVAVPIKKGDLFIIHGAVDHCSLPNRSAKSRHTFQLHLVEGPSEGVKWSDKNWLQYKAGKSFPSLL